MYDQTFFQQLLLGPDRYPIKVLARETGIAPMTLARIRDGTTTPSIEAANRIIAVVLEVAIAAKKAAPRSVVASAVARAKTSPHKR